MYRLFMNFTAKRIICPANYFLCNLSRNVPCRDTSYKRVYTVQRRRNQTNSTFRNDDPLRFFFIPAFLLYLFPFPSFFLTFFVSLFLSASLFLSFSSFPFYSFFLHFFVLSFLLFSISFFSFPQHFLLFFVLHFFPFLLSLFLPISFPFYFVFIFVSIFFSLK